MAIAQPQEVLLALHKFQPDLVLMDVHARLHGRGSDAGHPPVRRVSVHAGGVSLSRHQHSPCRVDALRLGGDHFLTKPFNPVVLNAVVRSKIEPLPHAASLHVPRQPDRAVQPRQFKQRLDVAVNAAWPTTPLCAWPCSISTTSRRSATPKATRFRDQVIPGVAWLLNKHRKTDVVGRYGEIPGHPATQADAQRARQLSIAFASTFAVSPSRWRGTLLHRVVRYP